MVLMILNVFVKEATNSMILLLKNAHNQNVMAFLVHGVVVVEQNLVHYLLFNINSLYKFFHIF